MFEVRVGTDDSVREEWTVEGEEDLEEAFRDWLDGLPGSDETFTAKVLPIEP